MRVLVAGASGLIGANLVRTLLREGCDVVALVREHSDIRAIDGLPVTLHRADTTGPEPPLVEAARGCDLVFHAAVQFSYDTRHGDGLEAAAVRGTQGLLRAARAAGVRRVVLTSSSVVFGHSDAAVPIDETAPREGAQDEPGYVGAKARQDRAAFALAAELGLELVAVCPTLSVGPHGTALGPSNGAVVAYLADPLRLSFPGGCNVVSVADVARGHWLAALHGTAGAHYLLGGENLTWTALHALVAELAGVPAPRAVLGHAQTWLAAGLEEWRARLASRAPLVTRRQATMVGRYYWYSHARAEGLGWRPRPARQALAEAISWLAASPHVSREVRAQLRLSDEVYAARRRMEEPA